MVAVGAASGDGPPLLRTGPAQQRQVGTGTGTVPTVPGTREGYYYVGIHRIPVLIFSEIRPVIYPANLKAEYHYLIGRYLSGRISVFGRIPVLYRIRPLSVFS